MRILWLSVSADAKTGYGKITRDLLERLQPTHEVFSAAHGGDIIVWGGERWIPLGHGKKVLTLPYINPQTDPSNASEYVKMYVRRFNIDLVIGFWDLLALGWMNRLNLPFCQYVPIDGKMTKKWSENTEDALKVIAYSHFGYDQLSRFLPSSKLSLILHGIDTYTFRPFSHSKTDLREVLAPQMTTPVPKEAFLFCTVEANYTDRKKLPLLIRTFAELVKIHKDKDLHLYAHCNVKAWSGNGYDLQTLINDLGIVDRMHFPANSPDQVPFTDDDLCLLYNASNCYVTSSCAEGFNIPILESMASGTPVIAVRNSAMTELVEGHGYLAENVPEDMYVDYPMYVPYMNYYPVVDCRSLLSKMNHAVLAPNLLERNAKLSRKFAMGYDWNKIMPSWFSLLKNLEGEIAMWKSLVS